MKVDHPEMRKMGGPAFEMKALAYEFLGDFDAALENYEKGVEAGSGCDATMEARLAYKKGEKAAAFESYCAYLEEIHGLSPDPAERQKKARIRIMCEFPCYYGYCGRNFDCRVLCPFADYASFLSFMEAEFKAQGEPAEKVPAMEFFRSLAEDKAAVAVAESAT